MPYGPLTNAPIVTRYETAIVSSLDPALGLRVTYASPWQKGLSDDGKPYLFSVAGQFFDPTLYSRQQQLEAMNARNDETVQSISAATLAHSLNGPLFWPVRSPAFELPSAARRDVVQLTIINRSPEAQVELKLLGVSIGDIGMRFQKGERDETEPLEALDGRTSLVVAAGSATSATWDRVGLVRYLLTVPAAPGDAETPSVVVSIDVRRVKRAGVAA